MLIWILILCTVARDREQIWRYKQRFYVFQFPTKLTPISATSSAMVNSIVATTVFSLVVLSRRKAELIRQSDTASEPSPDAPFLLLYTPHIISHNSELLVRACARRRGSLKKVQHDGAGWSWRPSSSFVSPVPAAPKSYVNERDINVPRQSSEYDSSSFVK
ncbi:hypothetical protein CPC08DRAFT_458547 [Agrocybe pediades]|nr:hypothetical protein CPC08DRAFT_458547 [Agrocybe pediades]